MEIFGSIGPSAAVIMVGVAVAGVVFALLSRSADRRELRETLSHVDGYDLGGDMQDYAIEESELSGSFFDRIVKSMVGRAGEFGGHFTPAGYVDKVRQQFVASGQDSTALVDRFIAKRVFAMLAIPFVFYFFFILNPLAVGGFMKLMITAALIAGLIFGPDARLKAAVEKRQQEILQDLPDVLDLLTISVEAGLGFEQALDRTITTVPGALSAEFARMLGETRAGSSRADAMRAMDARIDISEVRSFVLAILQADTFGVSIGRVLRAQADEMRIRRRQLAQEKAQKAPVKMLIPMVLCIFPALFVVILVPAMLQIVSTF